jgi:nucleotide-binding universal stress UspA family protein
MNARLKNVLIAVDGSEQSFQAVRYIGRILPGTQAKITLFHVLDLIPDHIWDFESGLDLRCQLVGIRGWEIIQRSSIEGFMEQAKRLLVSMGYAEEGISLAIEDRRNDVAQEIARKAREGFDALVVGRQGVSQAKDLLFGSISYRILSSSTNIPVCVVGGSPDPNRILIALDNSDGARRALEYVTEFFQENHPELLLLHVSRRISLLDPDFKQLVLIKEGKDWMERADRELRVTEDRMESYLQERLAGLARKGLNSTRIGSKIIHEATSRSAAIVKEALEGGYGTIVVGRRGLSKIDEFIMGRVSSKILQLAKEQAVWVVH